MTDAASHKGAAYRVLARKYRPSTFSQLIGQDAMVRTLSNAIRTGRLAHAFILTGVRGVGKTTTARLIARALNCVGADGTGGATIDPCGQCDHCVAIAESRHVDVMEMDAASRTGVDDIREIIDGVRYAPVSAREKVYIVDEVHMLSKNAFNALLKTLEEPPERVRFIFATTEIRKVPVTVLSRCQRFDLRRVSSAALIENLRAICDAEKVEAEDAALALIVRAAEGSVRDSLSLLDQAFAYASGEVTETQTRDMLGLADRARMFDLFEAAMKGDMPAALAILREQYDLGADPLVVLGDLLEIGHWLTRLKVAPEAGDAASATETERERGRALAMRLDMPALGLAWQMLLKGLEEARRAPSPIAAAEMALVRLAFAADLPPPGDLKRRLDEAASAERPPTSPPAAERGRERPEPVSFARSETVADAPRSFAELVDLFQARGELVLHTQLTDRVHFVSLEPGKLEIRLAEKTPAEVAHRAAEKLSQWTGLRWMISLAKEGGAPTLREQAERAQADAKAKAKEHPFVRDALDAFPGAEITAVRER